ncbi:hypothetical protein P4O66_000503 [Electrophorus voltai]|uniref:Ig-like domain-containing protein n=1 Tax=Electrophorus voltai TaxID=2609070 RepID=A0AAD8ZH64_9TELE|nr:hypothetical protein P4O66_000503 [Electrophorus voltai]
MAGRAASLLLAMVCLTSPCSVTTARGERAWLLRVIAKKKKKNPKTPKRVSFSGVLEVGLIACRMSLRGGGTRLPSESRSSTGGLVYHERGYRAPVTLLTLPGSSEHVAGEGGQCSGHRAACRPPREPHLRLLSRGHAGGAGRRRRRPVLQTVQLLTLRTAPLCAGVQSPLMWLKHGSPVRSEKPPVWSLLAETDRQAQKGGCTSQPCVKVPPRRVGFGRSNAGANRSARGRALRTTLAEWRRGDVPVTARARPLWGPPRRQLPSPAAVTYGCRYLGDPPHPRARSVGWSDPERNFGSEQGKARWSRGPCGERRSHRSKAVSPRRCTRLRLLSARPGGLARFDEEGFRSQPRSPNTSVRRQGSFGEELCPSGVAGGEIGHGVKAGPAHPSYPVPSGTARSGRPHATVYAVADTDMTMVVVCRAALMASDPRPAVLASVVNANHNAAYSVLPTVYWGRSSDRWVIPEGEHGRGEKQTGWRWTDMKGSGVSRLPNETPTLAHGFLFSWAPVVVTDLPRSTVGGSGTRQLLASPASVVLWGRGTLRLPRADGPPFFGWLAGSFASPTPCRLYPRGAPPLKKLMINRMASLLACRRVEFPSRRQPPGRAIWLCESCEVSAVSSAGLSYHFGFIESAGRRKDAESPSATRLPSAVVVRSAVKPFSPFWFAVEPADTLTVRGLPAILNCSVHSALPARVRWKKDGLSLVPDDRRQVLPDGALLITSVMHSKHNKPDEGVYQCVATIDSLGTIASRTARLSVAVAFYVPFVSMSGQGVIKWWAGHSIPLLQPHRYDSNVFALAFKRLEKKAAHFPCSPPLCPAARNGGQQGGPARPL